MTPGPRMLLLTGWLAATAAGQTSFEPHIGYVYPCGGQRGATVELMVGGQYLGNASEVFVSGNGVKAEVIQHYRPLISIEKEQRQALRQRMRELSRLRLRELNQPNASEHNRKQAPARGTKATKVAPAEAESELPEHPLLRNLENKSLYELQHIHSELVVFRQKKQISRQLAETVLVRLTIASNAAPGDRELRLLTPQGLSNPLRLQVGDLPEVRELEPNDPQEAEPLPFEVPPLPPLKLPVLINGRVNPGDVDHHRFVAAKGQKLVIRAQARYLMPFLADAVPGWFQATMTLYDADGRQIASADDYRFDPDPVMLFEVPADGEYIVEIRDSIYRGREDFVYRLSIGEQPFVTEVFPPGGRGGSRTTATIEGWNLPSKELVLATPAGPGGLRTTTGRRPWHLANSITYDVGRLPECEEVEPNNDAATAQGAKTPTIINGRIDAPGDTDMFSFQGRKGGRLVAEVLARRLGSPMDSLLRVIDTAGKVVAWNDDCENPDAGLITHHADSYLVTMLPEDGTYFVQVSDAQNDGSRAHVYRLRVGPPRPDYAVWVTPSSLNIRPAGTAALCVHVLRKDGFEGPITIELDRAPKGFVLDGNVVPDSLDLIRMTLTAPATAVSAPVELKLEAEARLRGYTLRRKVVPADDVMQAFAYRHLVPAQMLMAANVQRKRRIPPLEIDADEPVRLPIGGTTHVRVRTPRPGFLSRVKFELSNPPAGVTLADTQVTGNGLTMTFKCDNETAKPGRDNLIVEAFVKPPTKSPDKSKRRAPQEVLMGVLPAIPVEVVQQ